MLRPGIVNAVLPKKMPRECLEVSLRGDDDGSITYAGRAADHLTKQTKQETFLQKELDCVRERAVIGTEAILVLIWTGGRKRGHGKPSSDSETDLVIGFA